MTLDSIPVVPGGNFAGHMHLFQGDDRLGLFQRIADTGELSRVSFLGRPVVFANSPAAAHEVLVEKARCFEKSPGIRLLLHYLAGEGLFTSEGELWRRHRGVPTHGGRDHHTSRARAAPTGCRCNSRRLGAEG